MRVRLFRLNPNRYMAPNDPTRDNGTAAAGITVAARVRRKRKITMTTKATASINSNCTSLTDPRIVMVRSVSTVTRIEDGKVLSSCGSSFLMRSATSMTLAPG